MSGAVVSSQQLAAHIQTLSCQQVINSHLSSVALSSRSIFNFFPPSFSPLEQHPVQSEQHVNVNVQLFFLQYSRIFTAL